MKKLLLAALLIAVLAAGAGAAEEKGWFGFQLAVEAEGFMLNPTVRVVKVESVVPNSPAAAERISPGDEIIEAEGVAVPGGRALKLKPIMARRPGERIRLRLKRPNGETYSTTLTAVKRPS